MVAHFPQIILKSNGVLTFFVFNVSMGECIPRRVLGLPSLDEFLVTCDWSSSFCPFWRIFRDIIDPVNLKFGGRN